MLSYDWTCHVCMQTNIAGEEVCKACKFPAIADGYRIQRAQSGRSAGRTISPVILADTRSVSRWIVDYILASEVRIAAAALAIAFVVVVALSWGRYSDAQFIDGIHVEAHGMLLDILVIGIFILWLNLKRAESERTRRYEEEIDDYREWNSDEASHRIAGNIRRLNAIGKTHIFLSRCYLRRANLREVKLLRCPMHQVDLGESNLRNAVLNDVNLDTAFLGYSDMRGASIIQSDLTRARLVHVKAHGTNFRGSIFRKAAFNGALLRGADFRDCKLHDCNFDGADLGGADLRNAEGLKLESLARAHSLSYARFDPEVLTALESLCPELLTKNRRQTKLPPKQPPNNAQSLVAGGLPHKATPGPCTQT